MTWVAEPSISPSCACIAGCFEVMATGGDSALGGDDFDHLLADWIKTSRALSGQLDARTQRELLDVAAAVKHGLDRCRPVPCTFAGWQGEVSHRSQFDELITRRWSSAPCWPAAAPCAMRVSSRSEVLEVVMVGGSTRVPLVREQVGEFFGVRR
jgi:molecular chaperone HscA